MTWATSAVSMVAGSPIQAARPRVRFRTSGHDTAILRRGRVVAPRCPGRSQKVSEHHPVEIQDVIIGRLGAGVLAAVRSVEHPAPPPHLAVREQFLDL